MSTTDERLKILGMLGEGKVSAEEAAQLLAAIARTPRPQAPAQAAAGESRWVRILVHDLESDRLQTTISLPASLLGLALRIGSRFAPELAEVADSLAGTAAESVPSGKLLEVVDAKGGHRVTVVVG